MSKRKLILFSICLLIIFPMSLAKASSEFIATIQPLGKSVYISNQKEEFSLITESAKIFNGTKVKTDSTGKAKVEYKDKVSIKINANTFVEFKIQAIVMKIGQAYYRFAKLGKKFKVLLPSATLGIRGTAFLVNIDKSGKITVKLDEGVIEIKIRTGEVKVMKAGNTATLTKDKITIFKTAFLNSLNVLQSIVKKKIKKVKKSIKKQKHVRRKLKAQKRKAALRMLPQDNDTIVNMELYGNKTLIIECTNKDGKPYRGHFEVFIDGCNAVNNKKLVPRLGYRSLKIKNFEPGVYDFVIKKAGTYYYKKVTIPDDDKPIHKIKFKYKKKKLITYFNGQFVNFLINRHKIKIYDELGIEVPVRGGAVGHQIDQHVLPQDDIFGKYRINFYIPRDKNKHKFTFKFKINKKPYKKTLYLTAKSKIKEFVIYDKKEDPAANKK